ncbi:MAG: phage holin family protein [Oscillospiraceae bacterium]
MEMDFLSTYFVPVIVGICLCLGFVVKQWVKDVDNKYIPTLNAVIGLALAIWIHWPAVTPEAILLGLFSGLASTGLYEAFRNLIGGKR